MSIPDDLESKFYSQRFTKDQRLKSTKKIKELFEDGSSFFQFPFKVIFLYPESGEPTRLPEVLISVPKKYFKKAVERNLIKRQIREVYRKNKFLLIQEDNLQIPSQIGILYLTNKKLTYDLMEKKLNSCLVRLRDKH